MQKEMMYMRKFNLREKLFNPKMDNQEVYDNK